MKLRYGVVPALFLFYTAPAWGQARVTGTVTSALDGQPLAGARVTVKGTSVGTLTGTNGRYALDAPSPNDTLTFAFIGYRPMAVAIAGRPVVNVAMEAAAIMMEEVVVTGYGTQQRRDVTGAVASVDAEDLTPIATASVDQMLQGRVAGVQVTSKSGRPGGDSAIVRIRGVGTLNNASPLYVVDGMLLDDISFLNPSDVGSVEVLKDASATAIYGSRGANGVIIITTKRGSLDRATRFAFRAYGGAQSVLDPIDLVNARQYAILANELAANQGQPDPYFPDPDTLSVNTDWQDVIFETAPIQSYELSSSGGTEKNKYYFSGTYFRQAGVIPHSDFSRVTLRTNNDYQLTDRLAFGHNIAYSYTDARRPPGVLGTIYQADPTVAPRNDSTGAFNDAGVLASSGNPAATVFYTRNTEEGARLVGNLFAELNVRDHFSLRSSFGLDYGRNEFRRFDPVFFVSPQQKRDQSEVTVETRTTRSWLWENTLAYNYAADRHRLTALAGITAQRFVADSLYCGRVNIVAEAENFWYCGAGDVVGQTNEHGAYDWKMLSYLFRTNYAFKDRYLFTASLRIDGSSRFGEANRFGHFPSFAVGWNLTEEPFMRDRKPFSALKLRASWGRIGNDKIGAYPGIPIVTGNLNAVFGPSEALVFGATPIRLANPEVRWERTSQTNIGSDMVLFDGRLEGSLDFYHRVTDGILVRVPVADYIGVVETPFVNAAKVRNSGVEGTFTWRGRWGGLDYDLGFNGATISNKVLELGQGVEDIRGAGLGNEITFATRTVVGQPIGCFWGYKVAGIFQTATDTLTFPIRGGEKPGDLRFADLGGGPQGQPDGRITTADQTFIGCPIPDLVYGFNTRLKWGRFDLSASFSGQAGNEVFNGKKATRFEVENFEASYLNRWRGPGTSNSEPRVTNQGHNYQSSERFIESGSFLKLQSLQLGYQLPQSLTSALRVQQARIYVSGTNLFQITDYTGYTPEVTAGSVIDGGIDLLSGIYPPARTITAGLDVTF